MTDASTATHDLADLIAGVVFERDGDAPLPDCAARLRFDDAFAGALETLEEQFDTLGDELAAGVYVLLRDVRAGVVERMDARVTAGILVRHVAAVAGVASVEPLIRVLGALAVLPDGPDAHDRALDPTPDPSSPIEVAMAAVVDDPGLRSRLRHAVHEGTLIVPVLDLDVRGSELSLQCLPLVVRGAPTIAVFTSEERLAEHAAAAGVGEIPTIEIDGDELSTICPPGHGVVIDPGWVLGCVLEEDEVRALPNAPSLRLPDDGVELSGVVHPAILGALDAVRPRLEACGVIDLVPATKGELVVLAVVVAEGVSPDPALRRAGTLLAERGLTGPVLVPSTSPLGQAVLDVAERD